MSEANLKRIALIANVILSTVIALLTAFPNFTPARSVPGGECYETCRNLTMMIGNYNAQIATGDKTKTALRVFTETPENIAFLKNEPSIAIKFHHSSECLYGTVGDLSENGFIVCRYHGSYYDMPELKNLEATFFIADKGIVKIKGLHKAAEFAKSFGNELRFYAVAIVLVVFILAFSVFSALFKFFCRKVFAIMSR